jgi:hypothetical protein
VSRSEIAEAIAYIRREAAGFPQGSDYSPTMVLETIADMLEQREHLADVFAPKVGDLVRVRWPPKGLARPVGRVKEVLHGGALVDHGDGEIYGWSLHELRNLTEQLEVAK